MTETLTSSINELLELSPPVMLALLLNIVGALLKKSPVPNWIIPWCLIVMGGVLFPFVAEQQTVVYNSYNPTVYTVIIGCCIGGASVALYEGVSGFLDSRKPKVGPNGP